MPRTWQRSLRWGRSRGDPRDGDFASNATLAPTRLRARTGSLPDDYRGARRASVRTPSAGRASATLVNRSEAGRRMRRAAAGLAVLTLLPCFAASPPPRLAAAQAPAVSADSQKLDSMLEFVRARNARDYAITSPDGIDEAKYVEVGGIQQWITIRGEDRNNPVLLFLHGGPGDATNPWGYAGFRLWLKHFTVVQWDQRGAGRTLGRNGSASAEAVTVNRLVQDGVELAALLARSLGRNKVVLVGHSWGSTLGVLMAKARPELFSVFVGTGQVADPAKNYAVAYDALLKKAE